MSGDNAASSITTILSKRIRRVPETRFSAIATESITDFDEHHPTFALDDLLDLDIENDAPENPRARITYIARRKIKGFCGTVDPSGNYYDKVFKQNQSLSGHVTADYHGRFLIELIQNGHDAHPREEFSGEIEVLLAGDEGEAGVLYVANRGRPFGTDNVDALCEMGLSSKPPGEAIGNKGLGFRSVGHVTDRPEIHSRLSGNEATGRFDGYSFTFAHGDELGLLLPTDRLRELARADLPHFHIPLWLDEQPDIVRDFARRGFATVIRLPLRGTTAYNAVRDEILGLIQHTAPILLFLRRLKKLSIRITGEKRPDHAAEALMRRDETLLAQGTVSISIVNLGETGKFLLARVGIAEADMRAAVDEGLESKQLPESWRGWTGDGEAALAVRLDDGPVYPRLYTFLPMGRDAVAPFYGYLHGSFFPTSNRKAIDPDVGVNRLVLDEVTTLAAEAVRWLTLLESDAKTPLKVEEAACAAVDLLAWEDVASLASEEAIQTANDTVNGARSNLAIILAAKAASALGKATFEAAALVPCLGTWSGDPLRRPAAGPVIWESPARARRLHIELAAFGAEIIAKHGPQADVALIWTGLGDKRIQRLSVFLQCHAGTHYQDRMTLQERAVVAEAIAGSLHRARLVWDKWSDYYRDLPTFMDRISAPLAGRRILFCGDGSLRAAGVAKDVDATGPASRRRKRKDAEIEASVFFPPRSSGVQETLGEDLVPPVPLAPYFAFLPEKLLWFGELSAARQFLDSGLVSAFESETVLNRISQVVQAVALRRIRVAGLRWAFAIWRRSIAIKRPISLSTQYRLYVPMADGEFALASEAIFSSGWPEETLGRKLQTFLDAAPVDIPDLVRIRGRRLPPPSHSAFGTKQAVEWTVFLTGLGVQRGLHPIAIKPPSSMRASALTQFEFCPALGISPEAAALWKTDIQTHSAGAMNFPMKTHYVIGSSLWWLPGQGDYHHFSDEAREAYAALIIDWLALSSIRQFTVEVHHLYNYRSDTRQWPTPVAAFLRSASWMPVEEPTLEGMTRRHETPANVWLSEASSVERYPPFLRRPSFRLSRALDKASEATLTLLSSRAQLRTFNAPDSMFAQIFFLTAQYRAGGISRYHEREFLNIYNRTWTRLADQQAAHADRFSKFTPPSLLLARRGGVVAALLVTGEKAETVYVRDSADQIAPGLIAAIGGALLDTRATDPARIGKLLKSLYRGRVRLVSEVSYELRLSGARLNELGPGDMLTEICPWLRAMVAIALEALQGAESARLPTNRSTILAVLDRIRLHRSSDVSFWLDGYNVTPTDMRPAYAFKMADGNPIVVAIGEGALGWPEIEACLPAICEAIDQPIIVSNMRLLVRHIERDGVLPSTSPENQREILSLCHVLMLDEQASDAAREAMGERLEQQAPWLRAIIHLAGGESAYLRWLEGEIVALQDRAALRSHLADCLAETGIAIDKILEACKQSFSLEQLREMLNLDFAAFNLSLVETGSAPDTDIVGQTNQLGHYIAENEIAILDALRNAGAEMLDRFEPNRDYARLRREVRDLKPEPVWAMLYRIVPDDLLAMLVRNWLELVGAPALHANPNALPGVAGVRNVNGPTVRKFAAAAAPLVRAWCISKGTAVPVVWQASNETDAKLRAELEAGGIFDYRALDETMLLRWCQVLGLWPQAMPLTLDLQTLGVAETDLEAARLKQREEQEGREALARSVPLNGNLIDPRQADWDAISAAIAASLPDSVLNMPIGHMADLLSSTGAPRYRSTGGGGGGGGAFVPVPKDKTDMIGKLGELTIYHWLKARQPNQDIDQCWISGIGGIATGKTGDDSKGYDFEIEYRRQKWYIEVKASIGDPCAFEMGETEVRFAREVAQSRGSQRYVIAYVGNVGSTKDVVIRMLPNPMGPEADGVLDIVGEGIRYRFATARS
ncbi:DUF3883 domain-containing protein [Agrobacterium leguminum]|uniref:sacsin N-terminal ATP-binding-like domain-containing protein n=1 Tax=Agrobacterium leguminum TaxID=2792015 RepID=UPI002729C781|nr:DUF3883 domain-containing protein [Agrobacterium leguminum]WLD98539.1 DUF3883 domain-containing protein [Agrobacterium leguminum]